MRHVAPPIPNKRQKAPLIIITIIALAIAVYILFEIVQDIIVEGTPLTSEPVIGAIFSFTHNVTATIGSWGYVGVFFLMLLESSSLPIPSEVILPFAGCLVSTGQLGFLLTVLVSTVAGVAGSLIDYYIGLKGVHLLLKYKILGRTLFSTSQLETAACWFNKRGSIMVFIGRLVPGVRTLISFPAGAVKMSMPKFLVYTTAGCLLWNSLLIYVGYYLGQNWTAVAGVLHYVLIAVVVAAVGLFVAYLVWKRRKGKTMQLD
jgi:membrane protein DedA with SNARE-associated domain